MPGESAGGAVELYFFAGAQVGEVVSSRANALTIDALGEVANAEEARSEKDTRLSLINEQLDTLAAERARLEEGRVVAERRVGEMLLQGRIRLWDAAEGDANGYTTSSTVVANAIRLSPPEDMSEEVSFREARVHALIGLSNSVQAGVPALIVCKGDILKRDAYHASIPVYDGLSVVLEDDSEYTKQFAVGINGEGVIPIVDATIVETDPASPDDLRLKIRFRLLRCIAVRR